MYSLTVRFDKIEESERERSGEERGEGGHEKKREKETVKKNNGFVFVKSENDSFESEMLKAI